MAILSGDKKYVTVVKGDTLWYISKMYCATLTDSATKKKVKELAAINDISNPDLIFIGQKIYLKKVDAASNVKVTTPEPTKATINNFGEQSNSENTLFATWKWLRGHTAGYKVLWRYETGDGVWFVGSLTTKNVDKDYTAASLQDTYSIPDGAVRVKFKVKPISETYTKNDKEVNYWTAEWSTEKTWTNATPLTTPSAPKAEIKQADTSKLVASLEGITIDAASHVYFQLVEDSKTVKKTSPACVISTGDASYEFTVAPGHEYKVRCRVYDSDDKMYSDWSPYSSLVASAPVTPSKITSIKASSETSVYLEWSASTTAETYDIQYTAEKELFDTNTNSGVTTVTTQDASTSYLLRDLESGKEYFFRVRAKISSLVSDWSAVSSVKIGTTPEAPTTWSSTTTAIVGENINLYWIHNSEDGSSETYAQVEVTAKLGEASETQTLSITRTTNDDDDETVSSCVLNTDNGCIECGSTVVHFKNVAFGEGVTVEWRVRTKGLISTTGDWSTQRTIDVYAPPSVQLGIRSKVNELIDTISTFPFYISALAGPDTQYPTGYQLTITAKDSYETTDAMGNERTIKSGDIIYAKFFDTTDQLMVEMSAGNIDLANNVRYELTCTASMNTGLTATATEPFTVSWTEVSYVPNAEIGIDTDAYTASIRPYCETGTLVNYVVTKSDTTYTKTTDTISQVYGEPVSGALTTTGERVYEGVTDDGEDVYYCTVEQNEVVDGVLMSVYRREFDGSFTEIATNIDSSKKTYVTDPHPSLDFARYRIVATDVATGAVSYYDMPGYPVGGKAVIIQWDEDWTSFETDETATLEQPEWTGSLLKLPYNIDVSDNTKPDVSLIEYIGRTHPVSYYGTHVGQSASWNVEIEKSDKETIYALRRLSRWMGDVYVREPSGSGYWANITVSFSQKHCDLIVPVSLSITRVEGGM